MKYIILTGGDTGANNLGDQWILQGVKDFYKKYLDRYKVIIMRDLPSLNPKDGFFYIADTKEDFEKLSINVEDIKLLHFYGGGYLNEYWYDWKIWQYHYLLKKGLSPRRVVFSGQGLGPFNDSDKLNDLKAIAQHVSLFGVRDRKYLNELKNSVFMFDDSVSLMDFSGMRRKKSFWSKFSWRTKKRIAVNFRPGHATDYVGIEDKSYQKFLYELLRLEKNNPGKYSLVLFPVLENTEISETKNFQKLVKSLLSGKINIAGRPDDYRKLIRMMKKFDLVITTSYHAALGGIYSGVPAFGIYHSDYYRDKLSGLQESIGPPMFQIVDINNFTDKIVSDFFQHEIGKTKKDSLYETLVELKKLNLNFYFRVARLLEA